MKHIAGLIALFIILASGSRVYRPSHPSSLAHPVYMQPSLVWGHALAESSMNPDAISKDGHDRGMFQFRDTYDAERGIKDPFNPVESVGHARDILLDNLAELPLPLAITAYKWGKAGARAHGIDQEYVAKVLRYATR